MKRLPDTVAEMAIEKVATLLADRVAGIVVKALMDANFGKRFASEMIKAFQKQLEEIE